MEKKRRARINHCLNELKTLILEAMKKDVSDFNFSYIHFIDLYSSSNTHYDVNFVVYFQVVNTICSD